MDGGTALPSGHVLFQQGAGTWFLYPPGPSTVGPYGPIREFYACSSQAAVVWADAWIKLAVVEVVPQDLQALTSRQSKAVKYERLQGIYHFIVLEDPLDQRHRYLLKMGQRPVLLPGYASDEEAMAEANKLIVQGVLVETPEAEPT